MAKSRDAFRTPHGFIAIATSLSALLAMLWRMRYGIDFSDEAFYIALPMRFALGDRPFVDELNIGQTAGLLIYPFVRIYSMVAGGMTGIVLFIRLLYIAFFALVGWSAYALARTRLAAPTALIIGTACICYIPYGLPGLSYNTLSMGLFASGLFVIARWLLLDDRPRSIVRSPILWAGVAHAAACFAYASLVLGVASSALTIVLLARGQRVRATLLYAAGGALFCVVISPLLIAAGRANLEAMMAYSGGSSAAAGFTVPVMSAKLTAFLSQYPQLPFAAFVAAISMTAARRYPLVTAVGLCFLPFLARGSLLTGPQASLGYVACFALLGPIFSVGLAESRTARVLCIGVCVPSFVAGAVSGLTSGNGVVAVGLGMYAGAIGTAIILAIFIDETLKRGGWTVLRPYVGLSSIVLVWILVQFVAAPDCIYRDGPRGELIAKVTDGPYKGLYTGAVKREFLRTMTADIRAYGRGEHALFMYDLPAGYLIAYRRPLVSSAWIFSFPSRIEPDAVSFRKKVRPGDLVIVDRLQPRMPLDRAVLDMSDAIVTRTNAGWGYTVYVVR